MARPTPSTAADRAERVRQLQARRAASGAPSTSGAVKRRRHAAEAARPIAAGIAGTAFFLGVTALVANEPAWLSKTATATSSPPTTVAPVAPSTTAAAAPPPDTPPPTTIVVEVVHHPYYVDQYGNPLPAGEAGGRPAPAPGRSSSGGPSAPARTPAPGAAAPAASAPASAPAPPPPPPPPSCSGSKCP